MATKQQTQTVPAVTTRSVWGSTKTTTVTALSAAAEAATVVNVNMQAATILSQLGKANALAAFQEGMAELKQSVNLDQVKSDLDWINSI